MKEPVYITGSSMLSSLGIGNEDVWEGVLGGKRTISERSYTLADGEVLSYPVYAMPNLHLRDWAAPDTTRRLTEDRLHEDQDFVYLLAAARLAIQEAGLDRDTLASAALVIGHENLGLNHLIDRIMKPGHAAGEDDALLHASPLASYDKLRDDFFRVQTFPYLFYLANALGVKGISYTVNNACASGLYALELGSQLIRCGRAETVLVVCADYAHVTEHLWLGHKGFGSESGRLRPFDLRRDGSVLGDGAAAVVLQGSRQAACSGRTPLGRYLGGSFRQDSWQMALPDVTAHTYSRVIEEAVRTYAGLDPAAVDLLIPHGAGMKLWDAYEAKEIRLAFANLGGPVPAMTALKGYFGHTLGANSLLESVLMLHGMKRSLVPGAFEHEQADPKVDLPLIGEPLHKRVGLAVKTVTAYGGFQAAAVFENVDREETK
ncbi:beta-ketoacyl synthase N-terminal-like domain-containing protein [Paenibacillus chitinolyticus]|uniref:beta-ketoacyl synthase N-terminal-like domain-containing protein n=1 Tax=Paenibacillus chitinolyticus TaxID=79263 RepID=UPI003647D431